MTVTIEHGRRGGDKRGSNLNRRRRREWLVETYRADRDVDYLGLFDAAFIGVPSGTGQPACRCYRCGRLLTVDTVTADRIIPGCKGGTYRRNNIRPACSRCNSEAGGALRG